MKSCILSKFYIKPQQRVRHRLGHSVVSYRNSTSNHNSGGAPVAPGGLYLIEILHQTTTLPLYHSVRIRLYLIEILHQTTTCTARRMRTSGVVSYRNSTSNHNPGSAAFNVSMLYLIEILHQTTTLPMNRSSCRLYLIEILHQTTTSKLPNSSCTVVSYRNSTSNHNKQAWQDNNIALYLIEILHQTTTSGLILIDKVLLTGCLPL